MIPSPSSLASRTVHHALLVHATRASPSVLTRPVRVREAQQRPTTRSQATLAQPRPSAGSTASARASASGEKASASQAASDSFQVHPRLQLTPNQVAQFQRDGFLLLESVLTGAQVDSLTARLEPLFAGEFDTGVYPDEWHWRAGLSFPHVTREICNGWKSDLTIASLVCSEQLGRAAATLMGWNGARVAQDSVWYKPSLSSDGSAGSPVAHHQDAPYISHQFEPRENNSCTLWVALDDVSPETGTLEYVRGSHLWGHRDATAATPSATAEDGVGVPQIHAAGDATYRSPLQVASSSAGVSHPEIVPIVAPRGSIAIHHQDLWHGSGPNRSTQHLRRSIGVHLLRDDCAFKTSGVGYIYARYKLHGETRLEETFFPVTYKRDGHRTGWLGEYCNDMLK